MCILVLLVPAAMCHSQSHTCVGQNDMYTCSSELATCSRARLKGNPYRADLQVSCIDTLLHCSSCSTLTYIVDKVQLIWAQTQCNMKLCECSKCVHTVPVVGVHNSSKVYLTMHYTLCKGWGWTLGQYLGPWPCFACWPLKMHAGSQRLHAS